MSVGFSVGIYDNNNIFTEYTNSIKPNININLTSGNIPLSIEKGELNIDENIIEFDIEQDKTDLNIFNTKTYNFKINKSIANKNNVNFKLFVYSQKSNKPISPKGDPIDFKIKYDNQSVELIKVENKVNENDNIILTFNEPVNFVDLEIDNKKQRYENIKNYRLVGQNNKVRLDVSNFNFDKELYDMNLYFEDLAGNNNSKVEELYVAGKDLSIELLTLQNDSDLNYNYNKNYVDFFNKTIYSKTNDFTFQIRTNKPSSCYFSSSLTKFKEFNNIRGGAKKIFSTNDNLIHRIEINGFNNDKIWVACQNKYYKEEISYLSENMGFGKELINLKVYNKSELEIIENEPQSLVTNNPFYLLVETNNKAICKYKIDSNDYIELNTKNYKNFEKEVKNIENGEHNLKFKCFDLINDIKTKTNNIDIDPEKGVKVVDYSPKYTANSKEKINITLSESLGVDCKYEKSKKGITQFENFFNITGNGIGRTINIDGLKQGTNDIFVYCSKDDIITLTKINIIYDKEGVKIENLTFLNGKYKSDYVGDNTQIGISYNIKSLIDINDIKINVSKPNETLNFNKNGEKSLKITGDFSSANNLKMTAFNLIGVSGSAEKNINFDLTPPTILINNDLNNKKVNCNDSESGCAEIYYGLSQTNIDCNANNLYNGSIDTNDKNYLCVKAFDYANNQVYEMKYVNSDSIGTTNTTSYQTNNTNTSGGYENENQTIKNQTEENELEHIDELDDLPNPDDPSKDNNNNTLLIITAIVVLLAGTGAGSFYAYKKGYLNNQLEKLGIHIPHDEGIDNKLNKTSSSVDKTKFTTKKAVNGKNLSKDDIENSNYDKHLNKLNKFIDSKINKSSSKFDKFKNTSKGKVDSYHDTLAKKKSFHNSVDKGDFDEFYKKSDINKNVDLKDSQSVEKEAENFEKYYQDKQKEKDTSKKTKDKKKK